MNDFDGLIIGQNMTEERISEFKDMTIGNSKLKAKKKKWKKTQNIQKLYANYNRYTRNVNTRRRRKKRESICEAIMTKNFSNLILETKLQIQEAQRIPRRLHLGVMYSNFRGPVIKTKQNKKP